ncbi:SoxY-related AACIE arm protein [Duganella callida]|uniref:SoxY-related AACIE arm protein n=1 Tax=Duganella callida TaxID=2561932 RepID=A0A4Y9RWG5_9BURK|nr:SoxY-related AACIE arm protein [Duganella callida]TFW13312.1 SoxY-related AACIE arm protein [Duganella callida]
MKRRDLLAAGAGAVMLALVRPAAATPADMAAAIGKFTGGVTPQAGKVRFDIAQLIDNGNAVPITVSVESPMSALDHVSAIALFTEKNPQTDVAVFTLGPRAGKAEISTRIRLATSQRLMAVAKLSDGSCWSQAVDVIVVLAACVEGEAP